MLFKEPKAKIEFSFITGDCENGDIVCHDNQVAITDDGTQVWVFSRETPAGRIYEAVNIIRCDCFKMVSLVDMFGYIAYWDIYEESEEEFEEDYDE